MSATAPTARDFALPDLGEGLEDAVLVEWHVAVGDTVALNQLLCTVETAKATVELPSPFAGVVVERVGDPGDTIPVGAVLVRVEPGVPGVPGESIVPGEASPISDRRRTPTLVGYGPEEGPSRRRRRRAKADPVISSDTRVSADGVSWRALAKPPVRKLARDLGVELTALGPGSGPNGVITRADVQRAAPVVPDRTAESAPARAAVAPATVRPGDSIPLEGIRARIAEHMTRSRTKIPDASCGVSVDFARLFELRDALRAAVATPGEADVLTPFALTLRLLVSALRSTPIMNATLDEAGERIEVHEEIHLGIGTATPRGLVVPVVRNAERLTTRALAIEVRRLADGARADSLTPGELVGSTFTVSNFGVFGLDEGIPVINHPEVAILGIGAIRDRPVVIDGAIAIRPNAHLTCAFDHRVCDGADAGAFLGRLRELIETPEQLVLDC